MNCITVFVVNQEDQLKNLLQDTNEILSHRLFILNNFDFDKKKSSYILSSDVLISYKSAVGLNENIVHRLSLMYTDPIYEKIIIPIGVFTFEEIRTIINSDYEESCKIKNLQLIIREDAMINGIKINSIDHISDDILEESDMMFAALNGEAVNDKYFMKALEELIPQGKFDFSQVLNIDHVKFLQQYSIDNHKDNIKIFYNPSNQINDKFSIIVIDNDFEIENYAFMLKRLDGLKLYIK